MKCSRHPEREAVAQCVQCGAYICKTCAEATEAYREQTGTLCVSCCGETIRSVERFYEKEKAENIKKIIVSIIFYVIGVCLAIYPVKLIISDGAKMLLDPLALGLLIGGIILCGFYTGISWGNLAKKEHEEYEQKHGVQYTVTENGIYREKGTGTKVLYFLCGTVFGVALTPVMLFVYGIKISAADKRIKESRETYRLLQQI